MCPHLADSEIANALHTREIRDEIAADDATRAIETWSRLGIERVGVTGLLSRIWELRNNVSPYDATYVAVAETLDVR